MRIQSFMPLPGMVMELDEAVPLGAVNCFIRLFRNVSTSIGNNNTKCGRMAAKLTDHIWTVKELLTSLPLPAGINT